MVLILICRSLVQKVRFLAVDMGVHKVQRLEAYRNCSREQCRTAHGSVVPKDNYTWGSFGEGDSWDTEVRNGAGSHCCSPCLTVGERAKIAVDIDAFVSELGVFLLVNSAGPEKCSLKGLFLVGLSPTRHFGYRE